MYLAYTAVSSSGSSGVLYYKWASDARGHALLTGASGLRALQPEDDSWLPPQRAAAPPGRCQARTALRAEFRPCPAFYKWLRRYEADGLEGLKDRSSCPHHSPRATDPEVIEKIIWLRQHYHFGPAKIAMHLQRSHDVAISSSGAWRILKRLNMNRLPASQRYQRHDRRCKRYEKQRPGHQLQVDVKFIEPLGQPGRRKRYYQFTPIDDCTRLRIPRLPRFDQKTSVQFIDYVLAKLPLAVDIIRCLKRYIAAKSTPASPNTARPSPQTPPAAA